eukprot:CAMPEP_0173092876 /NCGR_PEP_ID=MMETSP1102-20130122/29452_1 /TAXON_ID=49646 /ORGANISM="Geminigera sp., Strain Caron Lab Isolate" /LENGTH=316 /DNA_ID=CAMNT_0013980377 /DNA_START=228 /DNA_END=1176 /DNA_ORIENTATION=-
MSVFMRWCSDRGLNGTSLTGGTYQKAYYERIVVVSHARLPDFAMCAGMEQVPGVMLGSHVLPINNNMHTAAKSSNGNLEILILLDSALHTVGVHSACTHSQVEAWLEQHVLAPQVKTVGLDLEWKPQFRAGSPSRVALLQLSANDQCLLVPLLHIRPPGIPEALKRVLKDPSIRKVGVGVREDGAKLERDWGSVVMGTVDLARGAKAHGLPLLTSLAKCSAHLLGLAMCKAKEIRMGNWEKHPLSGLQSAYAALDAWVAATALQRLEDKCNIVIAPDPHKSPPTPLQHTTESHSQPQEGPSYHSLAQASAVMRCGA